MVPDCENIISNDDIMSIYKISNLNILKMSHFCEEESSKKSVDIELQYDGNELLEMPVTRDYFLNRQLLNKNQTGKVAYHLSFIIKKDYRNQGLSKTIHENELLIYRNNSFQQIQLQAASDGLVVWSRLLYKFVKTSDEKMVLRELRIYLQEIKKIDDTRIEKMLKLKISDIDASYFYDDKVNFTDWLRSKDTILTATMYKDVA